MQNTPRRTTASKPLILESGPQLLIDDYLVDDIWMIRRSPELPIKSLDNPILEPKAEFEAGNIGVSSVIYDNNDNIFRMWYGASSRQDPPGSTPVSSVAYAVSEDGLHWETPNLGLIEYNGSKDNNLCLGLDEGSAGTVLFDPHDPDPQRRYKMMHKRPVRMSGMEGRVTASYSPDGIHWTPYFSDWRKSVLPRSGDGLNATLYNPKTGKYELFCRPIVLSAVKTLDPREIGFPPGWVREADFSDSDAPVIDDTDMEGVGKPRKELGFPTEDDFVMNREAEDYMHRYLKVQQYVHTEALRLYKRAGIGCNRRIARAESDDFINWTIPEVVIRPDELDPPKLYNLSVGLYNGLYIGALQVFQAWGYRSFPGSDQENETFDLQLAFSRDGRSWERLANRPTFIPRGLVGAFDGGMISTASPPLVEYRDEIRIYYNGSQFSHLVPGGKAGIGVARLPKERLVARVAGDELGVLITKPFVMEGDRLKINADARRGLMKVEVADIMGDGIPGFTVDEAGEIKENGLRLPVKWKSGGSLKDLRGKTVRLRFYMLDTRLYSFLLSNGE